MNLSPVVGTWLLTGERIARAWRTAGTMEVTLDEPLALLVDDRLAPRPGDVLLMRVDSAGAGANVGSGDELLLSHGEALPAGVTVTTLGLLVDSRCLPVTAPAPGEAARPSRRRLFPNAPRVGRLSAQRAPAG